MKNTENHNEAELNIEGVSEHDLKRSAFKTPEGYFENLTPRLMESVRASEATPSKPIAWGRILVPTFGLAASVLAVSLFLQPKQEPTPTFSTVLASLSVEELTDYADLDVAELVTYELVDYDQIESDSQLTDEDVMEYLETEEEIELNTIVNEIDL